MLYKQACVLLLLTCLSCQEEKRIIQEQVFEPKLIRINVEDIKKSVNWYTEKLGFEIESEIKEYPADGLKLVLLKGHDFCLELMEKVNSYKQSEVLTNDENYLGGIFKMGFILSDLQGKYDELKQMEGVEFVTNVGKLPENQLPIKWPSHHFLIKDPDGNFIQFFKLGDTNKISPWLLMITVEDLSNSVLWYTKQLDFKHLETVGDIGNRRAILERNNYVLELYEPKTVIKANQIVSDSSAVLGFNKIAFGTNNLSLIDSTLRAENAEIIVPIEISDFDWALKTMTVKDLEGNWIQLFETKE